MSVSVNGFRLSRSPTDDADVKRVSVVSTKEDELSIYVRLHSVRKKFKLNAVYRSILATMTLETL